DLHSSQTLGSVDGGREVAPEILQHLLPVGASAGDVVELVLEVGGEIVLNVAVEELREEGRDDAAALLGDEPTLLQPDVLAVLQHLDDRSVGRGPADPELLELLHQARLAVARWRLGEVLLRRDSAAGECGVLGERRQAPVLLVLLALVVILVIEREEAVENAR